MNGYAFSMGPFLMCFIVTLFLSVYLYVILYHSHIKIFDKVKWIFSGIVVMLVRMILPVNFPVTKNLIFDKVLPEIAEFLYFSVDGFGHNILDIIVCIWFIGMCLKFLLLVRRQYYLYKVLARFQIESECAGEILRNVLSEKEIKKIRVAILPAKISPAIVGLLHPIIILPEEVIGREELRYILRHEIEHYRNHDLWMKFVLELAGCAQWANPVFSLLKMEFNLAMEISKDRLVANELDESQKIQYASCILEMAKSRESHSFVFALPFVGKGHSNLKTRMNFLLNDGKVPGSKRFSYSYIYTFVVWVMVIITLVYVPEPGGIKGNINDTESVYITPENAYFIDNGKEYEIYVNEKYYTAIPKEDVKGIVEYKKIKIYEE